MMTAFPLFSLEVLDKRQILGNCQKFFRESPNNNQQHLHKQLHIIEITSILR